MEKEEILVSEFRALVNTIFNCSVKNKIVSSIEGNCGFHKALQITPAETHSL